MKYSVGIPVRNEVKTIESCLESILNQTISPSEILVCVNGSNDGTLDLVQKISKNEKKIKVIESKPGKPNAWNEIFRNSKNNYLMFTDGDVLINHLAAENFLEEFKKDQNLSVVGSSVYYLSPKEKTIFSKFCIDKYDIPLETSCLVGRLYMSSKKRLSDIAKLNKISLLPTDLINEDGFIDALALTQNSRKIIDTAYAKANPPLTFKDWYITTKRILEGQKQLKEEYSDLLDLKFLSEDFRIRRLKSFYERFIFAENSFKRLGCSSLFMIRQMLKFQLNISKSTKYNNLWEIPQSTKVPFD